MLICCNTHFIHNSGNSRAVLLRTEYVVTRFQVEVKKDRGLPIVTVYRLTDTGPLVHSELLATIPEDDSIDLTDMQEMLALLGAGSTTDAEFTEIDGIDELERWLLEYIERESGSAAIAALGNRVLMDQVTERLIELGDPEAPRICTGLYT